MAKAIKSALVAALVTFVTFLIIGPAGLGLTTVTAGTAAIVSGVSTLVASGVAMMTSKGIEANLGNLGTKITSRNATAGRQIVYGECRVGGTILHMQTSGTDNNRLHMIVAIAGHEIESLVAVRINDNNITLGTNTSTSTIGGQTVHTVTSSAYTNTDNDNNFGSGRLIRFSFNDGAQTSADGFARNQLASTIPSTHVFKETAYVYIQMVYDPEKLAQPPQLSFHVKGKKCYDPRDGSTAYTDNSALIIRDYLTSTTYGLKALSSEINDTSNAGGFSSAANTSYQDVSLESGTGKRYVTNGFTTMIAEPEGVLEGLLAACAGKMTYTNGQFNLFVGASQTPSMTITDDVLLDMPQISTRPSNGDMFNAVKAVFVDKSNDYTGTDGPVFTDTTALAADTPSGESSSNYVKMLEVQMPYVTTRQQADRLGKIALRHSRQSTTMQIVTTLEFMKLQPCDWVYVTNERLGYTNKVFEVVATNMEIVEDGETPTMATALSLKEIESAVFNHAANEYVTEISEGGTVPAGDMTVTAPSSLTLSQILVKEGGTAKINVLAAWANNTSPYIRITEVQYKLSGDSDFTGIVVGAGVNKARIQNVAVGETYNVKVRHQNIYDVYSSYTSISNITITAAAEAPAAPTGITASTGKELNILVSFTNSSSADMKAVKIYRKTSNTTPTSDTDGLVHTMSGVNGQVSTWLDGKFNGLTAGVTYYYWAKAINTSDVASSLVGPAQGNFTDIEEFTIANGSITQAKIAVDAIQGAVIAAGAITATKIGADAVTTAKLANDAVTAAVVAAGAIGTSELGVDAVTSVKIANNAITSAKIGANAVTTAKIANDAITEDLIAADAITETLIADDAISTAKIAANAITASEIAANTITSSQILANTITAGEIAAGTVTASEMAADSITATELAADSVTANAIAADAVTADAIAANTITSSEIAADTITASQIAADTITSAEILANTITAGEIAAGAIDTDELKADAVTAAKILANTITASEIAAGTITATEILAGTITATEIAADTITANEMAADSIGANEISVTDLAAISADMGTITAGSITAGSVSATTLNLNGATLSADANGLKLNLFDAFTHINTDTMGRIGGTAGNDVSMTSFAEISQSNFVGSDPRHIAAAFHSDGNIAAGSVMGSTPLFSHAFTTKNFSGTREFVVNVTLDPVGSYGSASSTGFAFAMRATTSASAYTATSASSYVTTRGTSIGGSRSSSPYNLNDIVSLSGNTTYYIWVFGVMDDVSISSSGARGIINGQIAISGLNK